MSISSNIRVGSLIGADLRVGNVAPSAAYYGDELVFSFNPASLFASGEPGFFIDADDWSTLFQDTAGTQPVTAPGQGVALALDKSGNDNHATQATTAARPLTARHPEGGVRNEVDGSDTLATQTVTVTAQERTLSFRGTGTVTLSGASTAGPLVGTGADDIVSLTFTPTAGNLTLTVSGEVNDAQLERGAARTNYQRRVNFLDVSEAGKKPIRRLYFNGTSHFMNIPASTYWEGESTTFWGGLPLSANTSMRMLSGARTSEGLVSSTARFVGFVNNFTDGQGRLRIDAGQSAHVGVWRRSVVENFTGYRRNGVDVGSNTHNQTRSETEVAFLGASLGATDFHNGFLDQIIHVQNYVDDEPTIGKVEKYVSTKSPGVEL